jgi:uncharacterized protein
MKKPFGALVAGMTMLVSTAAPAVAHVTVAPSEVPKGGYQVLTFRVPNERDDAKTTSVEITFPADQPLASARVQPVPGWEARVEKAKLAQPLPRDGGDLTEAVSKITFSGGEIGAGEFQQFYVSAGPFPDDGDSMAFKALQTYSDGEVVRWIETATPGGDEPEHPAPAVTLVAAAGDGTTPTSTAPSVSGERAGASTAGVSQDDVDSAKTLGIVGIVIGALGLIGAGAAIVLRRRAA